MMLQNAAVVSCIVDSEFFLYTLCYVTASLVNYQVDGTWRSLMRTATDDPSALVATAQPGMLETLTQANTLLEEIQKGLNDYLEKKRLFFPRYREFISFKKMVCQKSGCRFQILFKCSTPKYKLVIFLC